MALRSIGRLIAKTGTKPMGGKATGVAALAILSGMAAGVNSEDPMNRVFDYAMESAFDDPNADRLILGQDASFGMMMMPRPSMQGGAAGGAIGGGALGALVGGIGAARSFRGAMIGGAVGTVLGAATGFNAAFPGGLRGSLNPEMMADAFGPAKNKALEAAMTNVEDGYTRRAYFNSSQPWVPEEQYPGVAGDPSYYQNTFPGSPSGRRRYSNNASGDIVLGLYNLRMG